ncbi:MAG: aspartate/glutamate racemase family protein [Betaproteobacteria bacterium]|nr:aspartate/glutamate racemase family protein [Betaproteobacteria bacterium]
MRILLINPNTTESMTAAIEAAAKRVASPASMVRACNPADGPVSIEGYVDEAFSLPGLLRIIRQNDGQWDAFVIACFDDTGLDAARCLTAAPVLGIGEAAFHVASMLSNRFSVITTLSRSVAAIEHNLARYGLAARCGRVRASEIAVLDLEDPRSEARASITAEIRRALDEDRVEAIVLGCAGMAPLAAALSAEVGVPVIDGVAAATKLAESLIALGLQTAKTGPYARPVAKIYKGQCQADSF